MAQKNRRELGSSGLDWPHPLSITHHIFSSHSRRIPDQARVHSHWASTAAYAEFWTNSYGKAHSVKVPRHQIWQTFIQESIRGVSQALGITFESNNNPSIAELTHKAYDSLGENGGIRLSDGHACSECTQDYKATADYIPQNNDPAAILGVDNDGPVPALAKEIPNLANIPNLTPNTGPTTVNSPVKMVVMDGIIMGPAHCYGTSTLLWNQHIVLLTIVLQTS